MFKGILFFVCVCGGVTEFNQGNEKMQSFIDYGT